MYKIIIKKAIEMVITISIATILIFFLIRFAPGDPARVMLGRTSFPDKESYEKAYIELRHEMKLDESYFAQYVSWAHKLLKFDLGNSIYTKMPVSEELKERLPATFMLTMPALIIEIIIGLLFGVLSAIYHGKIFDNIVRFLCIFFSSIPAFALGLFLIYFFSVKNHIFEISNAAVFSRVWLPALTLGVISSPGLARVVRTSMLDEFGKPYVYSLISRGLNRRIIIKNALKNIMLPLVTMITFSFVYLIAGAIIIESVFTWPGIGKYAMDSILVKDYPVIQGYSFIMVTIIVIINFITDLIYAKLDPNVRTINEKKSELTSC